MAGLIEFVIFGGLAYWLFNDRCRSIVDLISTKLQELYDRWELRGKLPQKKDKSYKTEKYTPADAQSTFNNILEIRKPAVTEFNCTSCGPAKRGSLINDLHNTSSVNILDVKNLKCHTENFFSKIFPQLCQALSFKKYPFAYIYDSVLNDEKIEEVYETAAPLDDPEVMTDPSIHEELLKKQRQRAAKILTNLRSTFSDIILRISSFVMARVMMKLFSSVVVNPAQINVLKKAEASNLPLIFLPLHRSHLDYIIITFILANNNMKSPLVAAGENLRIPFFGALLRGLGAFFIKRRMDPVNGKRDILYRAVLHTYMIHSLRAGHNFEFFIEGGRTRSGKPCMPKGGLLSVFLDAYMDGTIDDALLIPVSINYERLVDGNFIREQMGQTKQMESFGSAISAIRKVLSGHYGKMRVDFNQPFSLSELVNTFQNKITPTQQQPNKKKILHTVPSTASLYGTDVVVEEHRQLIDSIARHVIYDSSCSTAAMSTNAVSFLLLNAYREGVQLEELALALDRLRDELFASNKSLGFSGESTDVIKHAIKILGRELVEYIESNGEVIVKPVTRLPNIIELSYYSNTLTPHFVLEAVVTRSIHSLSSRSETKQISHSELLETSHRLCEILQYEFIFSKYCQSLDAAISSTIETLISKDMISSRQVSLSPNERFGHEEINGDKTTDNEKQTEIHYMENSDHPQVPFYNAILQPLLDVYTISCLQLHSLLDRHVPEKILVEETLGIIKTQVEEGKLKYGESMSVDTIRNSLKLLEKWDVLDGHTENRQKIYSLGERYDDELSLDQMISRIEQFQ